ncbi:MAG: ABC transporter permease [Gaiellales bacterium]
MSDGQAPTPEPGPPGESPAPTPAQPAPGLVERYTLAQRAAGLVAPVITAVISFLLGGLVILASTGKAPWGVYQEIFKGAGLSWFFEVGNYKVGLPFTDTRVWFPWNVNDVESLAASNLQQTLITTTTLMLTGLAVAFAFRCGLFNIGGQGQYIAGAILAVIIGSKLDGLSPFLHVVLAIVLGTLGGALLAGIAGYLKATVGTHEVIATIMLNWTVIWIGVFLFTLGGPLQNEESGSPISHDVVEGSKLSVFWGDPLLQGLHIGFFIGLLALVVYWAVLNRTTLGYGVRAVGFNPEAARYGGINVSRNYFLAMAISGAFAGLAGAIDIIGWQFRISQGDILTSSVGFVGIAVALLGRNTAIGVGLGALLFGSLLTGTSTRNLDPEVFKPELASNLTLLIQGLIVLFVGADVLVVWLIAKARRR